jgi:small subunit ribosomal protein S16
MALKIRLRRVGRKNQPSYRIVVADSRKARDGTIVAMLGHYQPRNKGQQFDMDLVQVREWLAKGATPSETVLSLLKKAGCFPAPAPKEA